MSKIIKSERCVETHPCRLKPIDVDAFFINTEDEIVESLAPEANSDSGADETAQELNEEGDLSSQDEDESASSLVNENNEETEAEQWSFNKKYKPIDSFEDENRSRKKAFEEEVCTSAETENVNLERLANVAETIESLFSGTKQQADSNAIDAQFQAGNIIEGANQMAGEALEQAKQRAQEIAFGAEAKANSILGQANQQVDSIINAAKEQSALIIEGAKQQAEKSIEKTKQQAEATFEKAKKEAAEVVAEAKKQAEVLLNEARVQGVSIKKQAQEEGVQAGRQEAIVIVRQELSNNLTQALTLIQEIETERVQRLTSSEPELLRLAVSIAEKIIGVEIKLEPIKQLEIVREALSRVTTANEVTIRINPEDLEIFGENLAMLQSSFSEPKPIKLHEDASITKGSCFIETDHGSLDARLKSQLDRIMTEFLKVGQIE